MKKLNWRTIILDLIYIALGIVFVIHPVGVEGALCYILAITVAVIGVLYLIGHFYQGPDEYGRRSGHGFVAGILLIILAVFIMVRQDLVISLVPFLFGLMVMIRGLMVIQGVFYLKKMGFPIMLHVVSGILSIVLGLIIMMFPFTTMAALFMLIGISMMVGGISGIIDEISTWNRLRIREHEKERERDMGSAQTVREVKDADVAGPEGDSAAGPSKAEDDQ